jgi:hypothetical protein
MDKRVKKIFSYALGILFIIFLILLPTILIQSTVRSVNLAVKIKNDVVKKKNGQPPIATIEPIEKVGFYHFLPGAKAYYLESTDNDLGSPKIGSSIKNLRPKEQAITEAKSAEAEIISLVDTNSPAINAYNFNLARLIKQNNLHATLAYDQCLDLTTLKNILPYLDAVKIEFGNTENNYCPPTGKTDFSNAAAEIQAVKAAGKHLEIVDRLNSSTTTAEINQLIKTVSDSAGKDAIIHFSDADDLADASTTAVIIAAREQALRAGFKYAYGGGINNPQSENTYCADGTAALSRQEDYLLQNNLKSGKCADGTVIPGIWK